MSFEKKLINCLQKMSSNFVMNSDFTNQDYIFMSQAIKLASKGQFTVRSNPLVGCVLVKNNEVIGKGWHQYAGGPHAEINAIKSSVPMTPSPVRSWLHSARHCCKVSDHTAPAWHKQEKSQDPSSVNAPGE